MPFWPDRHGCRLPPFRVFAALALIIAGVVLSVTWSWTGGWVVVAASVLIFTDALFRLRRSQFDRVLTPLLLDVTGAGLAVLITGLPPGLLVVPLFYDLVSAVFALPRRWSIAVGVYAVLWSLATILFEPELVATGLSQWQREAALVVTIVIYFSATYLMTLTASGAVQDRYELNAALREKESRLQTVVDSTPIVLYAIDNDGVFTLSEGPGLAALGLKPGQVVGMRAADVYADNPSVLEMVNSALRSDEETTHEVVIGETSFAVKHRPQIDSAGVRRGTVGVAIDVTSEANYRRKLEQEIRSKDEFVAAVSHELRTPLTVVYGLSGELRSNGNGLREQDLGELHDLLAQQSGEVVAIVEDLLVAARADIDRLVVVNENVDIGEELQSVLQPFDAEIAIRVVQPDEPVFSWCDAARTRQVLRNLIGNATRHGGQHIEVVYGYREDKVVIEVRDDGAGVPEGEEVSIFDAYYRTPAAAGNPASIGLGLTVARKLAVLMGGDLHYHRQDNWSVFSLALPVARRTVAGV